jgi:hypothetical protein
MRVPRKTTFTHDAKSLRNVVNDLEQVVNDLKLLAETVDLNKIESVQIDFAAEVRRAMKYLPKFASRGHETVRELLIERGRYGATSDPRSAAPETRKTPRK